MSYEVDDSMTSLKKMEKRVKKINEIAGEKDFVLYDPNHHAPKHLGGTHIRFDMDFNKAAMSCIFEGADCAVEGSHTRRVKWALSWIKRTKDPIKKLKRAGRYLRRRLSKLNSKYVRRVFDYIGEKNISMKAHLEGSQLNIDGAILSERLADAI